jgi:hypothetical protein
MAQRGLTVFFYQKKLKKNKICFQIMFCFFLSKPTVNP